MENMEERDTLYFLLMTLLCVFSVFGNTSTICLVLTGTGLKTVANLLIANLAFVDLLSSIFLLSSNAVSSWVGAWVFGQLWCTIHAYLSVVNFNVCQVILSLISTDAYMAINHPFKYRYYVTKRKLMLVILTVWLAMAGYCLPMTLVNSTFYHTQLHTCVVAPINSQFNRKFIISQYALRGVLLLNIITCYCLIFRTIKNRSFLGQRSNVNQMRIRAATRAALTMFLVILMYLISWFPSSFLDITYQICKWSNSRFPFTLTPDLMKWANAAHYLPPATNPLIYAVRKEQFRRQIGLHFANLNLKKKPYTFKRTTDIATTV